MTDYREHFKEKGFGFGKTNEGRILRSEKHEESRKNQRAKTFDEKRGITETLRKKGSDLPPVVEDRMTRLIKWKAERDRRKKMGEMKKKPPFKVGIVHHRIYSPANMDKGFTSAAVRVKKICDNEPIVLDKTSMRITRATEKQRHVGGIAKKTALSSCTSSVIDKEQKNQNSHKDHKSKEQVFAFDDHTLKAPVELITNEINTKENISFCVNQKDKHDMDNSQESAIENLSVKLSSDEHAVCNTTVDETQTENNFIPVDKIKKLSLLGDNESDSSHYDSFNEPVFFSPYVVSSRGKNNARKEQKLKRGFSHGRSPVDDIPTKDTVMKTLNISIEEEERTAQYFLFMLDREVKRLNELCDKWTEIKSQSDTKEDEKSQINQAIGQTTLLINKKFNRFRNLVSDCLTGKGEMLVTCKDLQGFWDMIYMEIKDCDACFNELEKLHSKHWIREQSIITKPVMKKNTPMKEKVVPTKKMVQKTESVDTVEHFGATSKKIVNNEVAKIESSPSGKPNYKITKYSYSNDQKFTPAKDVTRLSLLQKLQLSQVFKQVETPQTVTETNEVYKTPEVQLDETISYVNSDQTPGKSILKGSKDFNESESRIKSTHKVNFDDHVVLNEVPIDEETQTKMDLAAAFARIDSFDFESADEDVPIRAERKLIFDDSFEEPEVKHDTIQQRNRTISPKNSSKIRTRSSTRLSSIVQKSEHKENRTPSRARRKNSVILSIKNQETTDFDNGNIGNISLDADAGKRRSMRRSNIFTAKDYTGCKEQKLSLPRQSHVGHSKVWTSDIKQKSKFSEELSSRDTLEKPRERVRRFHTTKA